MPGVGKATALSAAVSRPGRYRPSRAGRALEVVSAAEPSTNDSRPDLDPGVSAWESRGVGPGAAAGGGSAFSLGV